METTFIGIDPSAGQRPFVFVALDAELRLLAVGQGAIEDALAFAAGQHQAVIAVSAPRRPNQGLLARPEVRQQLAIASRAGRWTGFRVAEFQLRQHNITSPRTPADESTCPAWMQMGFSLHRQLDALGYRDVPPDGTGRVCLEVYPYACFTTLLGLAPFPKNMLEGRLQRQMVLHEQKLHIQDAMLFFEEITPHRLLKGILPLGDIYTPAELDALVAVYTARQATLQPQQVTYVGDPVEGQIVLPVAELKPKY